MTSKRIKRILSLLLAAVMLTGSVFSLGGCAPWSAIPESINELLDKLSVKSIQSDGETFSVSDLQDAISQSPTIIPADNPLETVGDKETLLALLLDRGALYDPADNRWEYEFYDYNDMVAGDAAPMPAPQAEAAPEPGGGTGGSAPAHSETNEQVEGVSEGDIVKTDGEYIYALKPHGGGLRIVRAEGADLEVVSTIKTDDIGSTEFYLVSNDRLVIIGNEYTYMDIVPHSGDRYGSFTVAVIYDISNKSTPKETRRVSMDGWSVSTRVIGSTLYMVTNKHIWAVPYNMADSPAIMPFWRDSAAGAEKAGYEPVAYDKMYIVPDSRDTSYLLVGALDVYDNKPLEPTAYFGAGSTMYMSRDAMYIAHSRWMPGSSNVTDVLRFAVSGTKVIYTGMGTADGMPINQYSMDEYDGYFRIATTNWGVGTYVTVMNAANMKTVGRTEPLEPNEMMRSMRFMGNMGYVVTFENTDPLFTIDLSDPYNPTVLGELKIPGFSQYLHPVGDGLLMGIGRDTEEIFSRGFDGEETVIGFRDVGLKVSLFDVSNPYDPKEVDVLRLGEAYAEVSDNPRALMTDSRRGNYGFVFSGWGEDSRGDYKRTSSALILSIEGGRLNVAAELAAGDNYSYYYSHRLCYIGNTLYVVYMGGIDAYGYNTFTKLGGITW